MKKYLYIKNIFRTYALTKKNKYVLYKKQIAKIKIF